MYRNPIIHRNSRYVKKQIIILKIRGLLFSFPVKVFFNQPDYSAGQQEHRDQVGNCHQAVKGFGDTPEHP